MALHFDDEHVSALGQRRVENDGQASIRHLILLIDILLRFLLPDAQLTRQVVDAEELGLEGLGKDDD